MKKVCLVAIFCLTAAFVAGGSAFSAEKVLFSFEGDTQGWEIPDWAFEQDDYVGEELDVSRDVAKDGQYSLKLSASFPGEIWRGAITETMEYFDWTPYSMISCDVYLPQNAPQGVKAKIVLTVGDNWKWIEMSRAYKLQPGEWTHIAANLKPGSTDWKREKVTDEFRTDVRKVAVRVETSGAAYKGPVYIDNFVLSE